MKIYESVFKKLLDEFSENEIEIKYDEKPSYDGSVELPMDDNHPEIKSNYLEYYEFNVLFKSIYQTNSISYHEDPIFNEYQQYIDRERNKLYDDINESILEKGKSSNFLNQLNEMKLRFEDVQTYYVLDEENKRFNDNKPLISHKRSRINKIPQGKSGKLFQKEIIISKFLEIQLESLKLILNYLEGKIETLKNLMEKTETEEPIKPSRDRKSIQALDRYQVVLLFSYLRDVGAIKDKSANSIAQIISNLTGYSNDTLRKYYGKIVEIKTGNEGNVPEITKDSNYNLVKVKNIILDILIKINEDIEKNKARPVNLK